MPAIDLADLRAEIELEREWREAEMRLLRNQVLALSNEDERMVSRKALVVMLYAHFEGLCKAILTTYVNHISNLGLRVADAAPALGAACLSDVFSALRDPVKKCPEFSRSLPDDTALHRFARDRDFVEAAWTIGQRLLILDADKVVDAESNLKPAVLRKVLFRAGLDPQLVAPWEGPIHRLLNRRNNVAHGTERQGISQEEMSALETAVSRVIDEIVHAITNAVAREQYRLSA